MADTHYLDGLRHAKHRCVVAIFALTFSSFLSGIIGCGGPQRAAPVDVDLARATLMEVLDHWKSGGTIRELRARDPEVVVQEILWNSETTLTDYVITENSRAENANWFCDVELTLEAADGKKTATKSVTYAVGTDPVLTVFHAML